MSTRIFCVTGFAVTVAMFFRLTTIVLSRGTEPTNQEQVGHQNDHRINARWMSLRRTLWAVCREMKLIIVERYVAEGGIPEAGDRHARRNVCSINSLDVVSGGIRTTMLASIAAKVSSIIDQHLLCVLQLFDSRSVGATNIGCIRDICLIFKDRICSHYCDVAQVTSDSSTK